jgi:hypothetical protein
MFLASIAHWLGPYLRLVDAMRVPELAALFLIVFPILARKKAQSLFLGLFEQTPGSLFLVTFAVCCLAGAIADTGHLILVGTVKSALPHAVSLLSAQSAIGRWIWLAVMLILVTPMISLAIGLSHRQKGSLPKLLLSAVASFAVSAAISWFLMVHIANPSKGVALFVQRIARQIDFFSFIQSVQPDLLAEHVLAGWASVVTGIAWVGFGIYGYFNLGRKKTVPALASLVLLVMMVTWPLAALTFFLDHWHIPSLLILFVGGFAFITAQSHLSDHTYKLIDLPATAVPQPTPSEVLDASGAPAVIIVAAEGGGIQAAAWTAQVLEGLRQTCSPDVFDPALRMISSVSGGSVGTACYLDWLLHPDQAKSPTVSASDSSLDEVAWGLTWPDLLRAALPWLFGWTIDRAEALQRAWSHNAAVDPEQPRFRDALSSWRSLETPSGTPAPAVIMNSTVVENGYRLLMGTSQLSRCLAILAREDASEINCIGTKPMDIDVVTAARLSASFTWVTPAARADADSLKPHLVDGGYYDNYGMATLVEWLDEALNGAHGKVRKVLVLQIHSSPVTGEVAPKGGKSPKSSTATRGWFFQLLAPFLALVNVRSAGQLAHNDIELDLLQTKWRSKNVEIQSVRFTFPNRNAPLSWHLIQEQKDAIQQAWKEQMGEPIRKVADFLRPEPPQPALPEPDSPVLAAVRAT